MKQFPYRSVAFVLAQGVSGLGAAATSFAIDVWVFKRTGSYETFAFLAFLAALPPLLLAPISGALVDRAQRKVLLLSCDAGSFLILAMAALAAYNDWFTVIGAAALMILLAMIQTVRWPALSSTVSLITPKEHMARITGLEETVQATALVLAPVVGAALFHFAGLLYIFSLHLVLLSIVLSVVWLSRLPPKPADTRGTSLFSALFSDPAFGFRWIVKRKQLLHLLVFMATLNIGCAIFVTSSAPIVLSYTSADGLAIVAASGGIGLVLGGIVMTATGGIQPYERGIMLGAAGIASGVVVFGFSGAVALFALGSFVFFFMHPVVNAAAQVVWRRETPVDIQGRVFSIRRMVSSGLNPLAIALSIPLATKVFGPVLEMLHAHVPSVGSLWQANQAGRLGLMVSTLGCAMLAVIAIAAMRRFLRKEEQLVDCPDGPIQLEDAS